eukprot:tig00000385_g24755.t1
MVLGLLQLLALGPPLCEAQICVGGGCGGGTPAPVYTSAGPPNGVGEYGNPAAGPSGTQRYIEGPTVAYGGLYSIEFWIRPLSMPPVRLRLFDAYSSNGVDNIIIRACPSGWSIYDDTTGANLMCNVDSGSFSLHVLLLDAGAAKVSDIFFWGSNGIPVGQWSHVVFTFNPYTWMTPKAYRNASSKPMQKGSVSYRVPAIGRTHYFGRFDSSYSEYSETWLSNAFMSCIVFGVQGGDWVARYVDIPPSLSLGPPFTIEAWVKPRAFSAALFWDTAMWDPAVSSSPSNFIYLQFCSCVFSECQCSGGETRTGMKMVMTQGFNFVNNAPTPYFFTSLNGLPVGSWTHIAIAVSATHVAAYRNGLLTEQYALATPIPTLTRQYHFIGKSTYMASDYLYLAGASVAGFRVWGGALAQAGQANSAWLAYSGQVDSIGLPKHLEYRIDSCENVGTTLLDTGPNGLHAALIGDVFFNCPPAPPSILSAAASPRDGTVHVTFTVQLGGGTQAATIDLACDGFGGPYAAVADVPAPVPASRAVSLVLEVALSFGGSYTLDCTAGGTTSFGRGSARSNATSVTIPEGTSKAAESALTPSKDPGAANAFLNVGISVSAVGGGQASPRTRHSTNRPAGHRLALVIKMKTTEAPPFRSLWNYSYDFNALLRTIATSLTLFLSPAQEYAYCELDLDASRCNFILPLASVLGDAKPTDFSYTSFAPWPARDPDARFPPADLGAFEASWPWSEAAFGEAGSMLGAAAASALRPPADCLGSSCLSFAPQRWSAYAFSACSAAQFGPVRAWPASAGLCTGAAPYDFAAKAASFEYDFRHFHAAYERLFYDTTSGLLSGGARESYEAGGMLGSLFLSRPNPVGSNLNEDEHRKRHFRVQAELVRYEDLAAAGGSSGAGGLAAGSTYFLSGTNCLDFHDADPEPSSATFEGNETLADVRRAYGSLGPFAGLLVQDARFVPFWARGVAFFGSFVGFNSTPGGAPAVFPLLKACSLSAGVALLKFDLDALAPAGHSASAGSVYPSVPWPRTDGVFFADAFPPGASLQAVRADGRVAEGGPLLYHALVRVPFFPTGPCPDALVWGMCPGLPIVHVTAALTWEVDPSSFTDEPVGARAFRASFAAPASYRTGVAVHSAPRILRTDAIPLADHWIVQNERHLHSGPGYGYLEGRLVDPPNGRYAFYVTGDRVVRLAKPDSYRSGIAGAVDGEVRIYGSDGWTGSRSEWTSVAAAVYKDGALFVVHTASNTRVFTFASRTLPRPRYSPSKRMGRQSERAPGSRLLRLQSVNGASFDAASVGLSVIVPTFPANIISATVVDDYSSSSAAGTSLNLTVPFVELPWIVFVVAEPVTIIKLHTRCPPGFRWNHEAAVFNGSTAEVDLCIPLPAGRASAKAGLLLDEDADMCPPGQFSLEGTFGLCSDCPAGQVPTAGQDGCEACRPGSGAADGECVACTTDHASPTGSPCTKCPAGEISLPDRKQCVKCSPGTHEKTEGECASCPLNFVAPFEGAVNCTPCAAGEVASMDGRLCFQWTYRSESMLTCESVPADSIAQAGSSSPSRCPEGTVPNSARTECNPCPKGTYELNKECLRCELNSVAADPGRTACVPCPAGHVSTADFQTCVPCPGGTYKGDGDTTCVPVPDNSVASPGSATYKNCTAGYVANLARTSCVACRKGSYHANGSCELCPLHHVAPQDAATSCVPCGPGFVASPDLQTCLPCGVGTYRSDENATCEPAPPRAVSGGAAAAWTPCLPGHVPNQVKSECQPCPTGSYQVDDRCALCPLNTRASAPASVSCAECPDGTVSALDGASCTR